MTTIELLQPVITANKDRQGRASQLNVRAGENIFPVFSTDEMTSWLQERLGGATSVAAITDAEALRLPSLDEEMIEVVLGDNPDQIELLQRTFQVAYQSGYSPRITLEGEDVTGRHIWKDLPDDGVFLPGGRQVEILVRFGYYDSFTERDIPTLKKRVREHLNSQQWNAWKKTELPVPDVTAEEATLPDIATAQYGKCVVEGTPLVAYGTLTVNSYRYHQTDPYFNTVWYRNKDEAIAVREASAARLAEIKKAVRDKRALERVSAEADAVRRQFMEKCCRLSWYELGEALYREVETRRYMNLPNAISEIHQWIADTKALVAKVEASMVDRQRQLEAEARSKAELELAERSELAVILQENGDDLASAREIKAFAEAVEEIKGARKGAEILRGELHAPYGRARRQDAISRQVPGLSNNDAGYLFLGMSRFSDVDNWLAGAVAWLEAKLQQSKANAWDEPVVKGEPADLSQVTTLFGVRVKHDKKK